ncbi:hypothetical protein [Singulisphaera acidiphila]|uniref:Uncharacterized protein n=1 Tax=Singulisphaera acidiphila (strain ATCC BAA-1392 / DSM 18658 / VKM B-2454 / MOB10) TaxID=886293 RepID=L0DD97_SINAD|nr:hypothetical protein [Singulisphaera acidiphila]AGA26636.1 hypothetical protein Sinac_2324 [Singulisphaera acidiphila DSM 18658]
MRGHRWLAVSLIVLGTGCQSGTSARRMASAEPTLLPPSEPGSTVVQTQPARELTWVDRHPLFIKPREYYDNSGSNRVVKTAAATVIGVPAGIIGEIKQIVVGTPPELRY